MVFPSSFIEGVKQTIRVALVSIIPLVISQLQQGGSIDWQAIYVAGAISFLMGFEKLLHEADVKTPLDMKGGMLDDLKK